MKQPKVHQTLAVKLAAPGYDAYDDVSEYPTKNADPKPGEVWAGSDGVLYLILEVDRSRVLVRPAGEAWLFLTAFHRNYKKIKQFLVGEE